MTPTRLARQAVPVAETAPRDDQLTAMRWDWAIFVLQHATDPQLKQVVLETVTRAGRRPHGYGEPLDNPLITRIAAEVGCPPRTVQAVLEAADHIPRVRPAKPPGHR